MTELSNPFENLQSLKTIPITDEKKLKSLYEELVSMDITSFDQVSNFLKQRDLIEKHYVNEMAESHFLMTTDVASEEKKKRKEHFDQIISPLIREYEEKLNKKFLESKTAQSLGAPFNILRRNQKNDIDLYCKENLELQKEIDKLSMELSFFKIRIAVYAMVKPNGFVVRSSGHGKK